MTEYRKQGRRMFYKIQGEQVTRVLNREKTALIEHANHWVAFETATDPYDTEVCTEQEFKEAYEEALIRIQNMEIN
jgi:hypothetical protein